MDDKNSNDEPTLSEWADQYRAEVEKLVANRAAQIEELLLIPDYDSAVDWIKQWKEEDSEPDSVVQKYRQTLEKLRLAQQSQETTEEASPDSSES
ncbi:MAG: hypothetical protein LDL41_22280 [Coleofasciculus sp. S288]|nr:hypothetical protein [Coleofasciculus sp. S288]